ncbi:hypothetical protein CAter10_1489 [Collimonas arenae]|nr:hypothetical protein CAter10_1489 [Collimonas arenae]
MQQYHGTDTYCIIGGILPSCVKSIQRLLFFAWRLAAIGNPGEDFDIQFVGVLICC